CHISRAVGQGTFIIDQPSSDESNGGNQGSPIQSRQPMGQSFTPTLNSVGFVRFHLFDLNEGNGIGASVYVNLRADSITGPIIGSTAPVFMPDGFGHLLIGGYTNFFFASPVAVTPGVLYYFQPVVASGDSWASVNQNFLYAGGDAYFEGVASGSDLWFREGIYVPEPSAPALLMIGA